MISRNDRGCDNCGHASHAPPACALLDPGAPDVEVVRLVIARVGRERPPPAQPGCPGWHHWLDSDPT